MKKVFIIILIFPALIYLKTNAQVTKVWESDTIFKGPESVAYDKTKNCLYISNFDRSPKDGMSYNDDYITKIDLDGNVLEKKFVENLTSPTGVCVKMDKLYIVERFGVVVFNLKENKIETRYRINDTKFLNDVAVDDDGAIYVSDSGNDVIYRIKNGKVEKWLTGSEIDNTNEVLVDGDKLILGVNSDSTLKSANLESKEIKSIATLSKGTIDGIQKCGKEYLVSHFEGELFLIDPNGKIMELLNTTASNINCADFEYVEKLNLLVIPALRNNKVFIYKYQYNLTSQL